MRIISCLMRNSKCYKSQLNVNHQHTGIVVHDTAGGNTSISRYVQPDDDALDALQLLNLLGKNKYGNDWNHKDRDAGVHAFIGRLADGSIATVEVLKPGMDAWGVGKHPETSKSYNFDPSYFQFEICDDGYVSEEYFNAAMKEAQEYCAHLCKTYSIDPQNIVSHHESYLKGYGCNHGDCDVWLKKFGKNMDWFREEVVKLMETKEETKKEEAKPETKVEVKEEVKEATEVKPIKVDWKDLLKRAVWTFLEGFIVALPAALTIEDVNNWWAIFAPAIMAGVSAVKTLIVGLLQDK